jgi:hypothetical protein
VLALRNPVRGDWRWHAAILAAGLAFAPHASAQVGEGTGSANSLLVCIDVSAVDPELRPEGYTELLGDVVLSCTGGPLLTVGNPVPTTNLVLYLAPAAPITSRIIGPNGASEVLLLIDEPGSGLSTGATGGYGPQAPQSFCSSAQQQSYANPCGAVIGMDKSEQYEVAVLPGTSTPAPNVFQGKIGDFGPNSVAFYNVPVLPPANPGVSRIFRITNLRAPMMGSNVSFLVQAVLSTSPDTVLPIAGPVVSLGVLAPGMTAGVNASPAGGGNPFQACVPQTSPTLAAQVTFTEGFATAFKTRVVPGGAANQIANPSGADNPNYLYAGQAQNLAAPFNQNLPGGLYGAIAQNSESGFILAAANTTVSAVSYTAGLADFGTRLKAVFTNIPAGVTLYVSTTNTAQYATPGGTSILPYAALVATGQSNDANGDGAAFAPLTSATVGSDGLNAYALTPDNTGTAAAIWEVLNADASAQDEFTFSVYIAYTGTPAASNSTHVALSFAPEPGGGTFSTANSTQRLTSPEPRFGVPNAQGGAWATINACGVKTSSSGTTCSANVEGSVSGVQLVINQALGAGSPWSDANSDGMVTVTDVQNAIQALLTQSCVL